MVMMNGSRSRRRAGLCALAVLLAACGGGGGDSDDGSTAALGAATPAFVLNLPPLAIPDGQETVTCSNGNNGSIGARLLDTVFVPDGAACQLNRTSLRGSIIVGTASTLAAAGVQVTGNLQAEGARDGKVGHASRFGGSIQIKQGGAAEVVGTTIGGDLQLDAQGGALRAQANRIGGNLQAIGNRGGVALSDNRIDGNLQCKENIPAPTGSGNQAASKEDQCARL